MTESETSRTKTVSETISSETSDDQIELDRWSNNITYRELVVTSCVGIMQFWWHPYLQEPRAFLPFLFLYNTFSVFIGYPMFYLELALGIVTRKGVLGCWDLAPLSRGVGWAMLATCIFTAFGMGIVGAYSLALLVHSFHSFLPWLHCAATAKPPCAARHRPLSLNTETPAQSFFHNFVLKMKRDGFHGGMGNVLSELAVYHFLCWILVYFIAIKRIYSYSKLVFFKDALAFFVIASCVIGATRLDGAELMFKECDWSTLLYDHHVWRRAIEYVLLEMVISQGSLVMLGSYCPKEQHSLSSTAMIAYGVSKVITMGAAFTLSATHGALHKDYGRSSNITAEPVAYSLIMWSDFVARIPGSQFWSALIFFNMFVLSVTSTALLVQTIMSTFTGRLIRKISWAFLVLICVMFCFVGIFTLCSQNGIMLLQFLMDWPISMPRVPIAGLLALVVTYIYGQTRFCEDLYSVIGEYPNVFLRVCWAAIPGLLVGMFLGSMGYLAPRNKTAGWALNVLCLLPIVIVVLCYLGFRFRVRNIMGTEK